MLKEGYYKCTSSNYAIITNMHDRIPVQKSYVLMKDEVYHVNNAGNLEIPGEGYAKITDSVEKILVSYETDGEIKHWQDVRERAAIAALQGVMAFFGSIDFNRDTIAKLAVEQADALIDELKKK